MRRRGGADLLAQGGAVLAGAAHLSAASVKICKTFASALTGCQHAVDADSAGFYHTIETVLHPCWRASEKKFLSSEKLLKPSLQCIRLTLASGV